MILLDSNLCFVTPQTVNTGFVCFQKASAVRTLHFFPSQARSFTDKQEYHQKMEY